ncbi:MAG: hypothetical protein IJX17_02360 [Clostridia bacterium]|nr:hypothetical protein [Clostridia bacterium]
MNLPKYLTDKINLVFSEINKNKLKSTQKNLTDKYKNKTGTSKDLISDKDDSIIYAVSRMPATYSVIYTLVKTLINQGFLSDINSVIDVGSGTGSVFFALSDIYDNLNFELFERNKNMIDIFNKLSDNSINVNRNDLLKDEINSSADIVTASYVLSEMSEVDRQRVFSKLLDCSKKYVLIVDTGTPTTYENLLKLKDLANSKGFSIVAPCKCNVCPLKNDYCQFFARVERSRVLLQAKSATLSYEDEKYFYLLFSKENVVVDKKRVIRRPIIKENEIELTTCSRNGVIIEKITKKNKEEFKKAKKIKINEEM